MGQVKSDDAVQNWRLLRILLFVTIILHAYAFYYLIEPIYTYGKLFTSFKWQIAAAAGMSLLLVEFCLLGSTWTRFRASVDRGFKSLFHLLNKFGFINILLLLVSIILYPMLLSEQFSITFDDRIMRVSLMWTVVLIASVWVRALVDQRGILSKWLWIELLAASLLFTASSYMVAVYSTEITDYPFTLYWSEASRYYYGSLFISKMVYGSSFPFPVLHPSQYLLHTAPFLLPNLPIIGHRLWHAFLWVGITLGTAAAVSTRFTFAYRLRRWIYITLIFLFLLIGPVFYHLQLVIILIMLGFNQPHIKSARLRRLVSAAVLLVAAAWAGISRVNWFPIPGLLAAVLLIFEQPIAQRESGTSDQPHKENRAVYALKLLILVAVSSLVALLVNTIYILVSGNPAGEFASSFTSNLLWYRLLPNPTYPPGILPAVLFISLPYIFIIVTKSYVKYGGIKMRYLIHWIRWISTAAILVLLFTGGLVVSTKIGGGSNLHNMDAYMFVLLLVTSYIFFDQLAIDRNPQPVLKNKKINTGTSQKRWLKDLTPDPENKPFLHTALILAVLLVYLTVVLVTLSLPMYRTAFPDDQTIFRSLAKIKEFSESALSQDGEILFITDRHLLALNYINDVPVVPEYEKIFLMEMAMAENRDYLDAFHKDIQNQRFALIVSEPLFFERKGSGTRFGEENDAWVEHVSEFIDCYYQADRTIVDVNIQLLTPRPGDSICP